MLLFALIVIAYSLRTESEVEILFNYFTKEFKKEYKDPVERANRMAVFKVNMEKVDNLNALYYPTTEYGITQFSDLTQEEFQQTYLRYVDTPQQQNLEYFPEVNADYIDWRTKGAVSSVKNQGQCGSCWDFSAVACAEGAYQTKHGGSVPSLSEGQVLDCDKADHGCNGGWMDTAFQYIIANGLELLSDYPYVPRQASCKYDASKSTFKFSAFKDVAHDEGQMVTALQVQPLSVAVDANAFQHYSSGLLTDCSGHSLNHGVTLVGYGQKSGSDAWIVKNSWGTSWGEQGYVYVKYGVNCCGINQATSYITAA